jgi:hypothetical protein
MPMGSRTNFVTDTHLVERSDTGPFLEGLKNTPIFLPSTLCSTKRPFLYLLSHFIDNSIVKGKLTGPYL